MKLLVTQFVLFFVVLLLSSNLLANPNIQTVSLSCSIKFDDKFDFDIVGATMVLAHGIAVVTEEGNDCPSDIKFEIIKNDYTSGQLINGKNSACLYKFEALLASPRDPESSLNFTGTLECSVF
ncbi:hypothetical protein MRY82_01785 [bacterium]|nr:hypothetical protein [bacterium]